ncbi:hypothetical protein VU04_09245 [Desulfobulbus sp. TB]|nr:hypothetical protein [Desulfobulbus sp. TB]
MNELFIWISKNIEWVFSGIGVFFLSLLVIKKKNTDYREDINNNQQKNTYNNCRISNDSVGRDKYENISGTTIINRSCNKDSNT